MHCILDRENPYKLGLGKHPQVGISGLAISQDLLSTIQTEAQLNRVLSISEGSMIEEATVAVGTTPSSQGTTDVEQQVELAIQGNVTPNQVDEDKSAEKVLAAVVNVQDQMIAAILNDHDSELKFDTYTIAQKEYLLRVLCPWYRMETQ